MEASNHVALDSQDLQAIDNVLTDVGVGRHSRAALLKRAGVGVVAAGAFGAAGPVSSALAASKDTSSDVATIIDTAATAEAFAILYLNQAIVRAPGTPSATHPLIDVLRAAGAAEYDHYTTLTKAGATPLTTHIWIPDALFADGGAAMFANIEVAETLFVNAYLIGITTLANDHQPALARYAGEILGTEAEHRTLARYAQFVLGGTTAVPDNLGFEQYTFKSLTDIVSQLEALGIGFGSQGATPGNFYDLTDFGGIKPGPFSDILANYPA